MDPAQGEEISKETRPAEKVLELSSHKAVEVLQRQAGNVVVLGADTVVCAGGRILGKPHTHEEAEKMIRLLSGRVHQVLSGVTLIELSSGRRLTFAEKTDVEVAPMTSKEIHSYAFSSEPMDKAGGYGIQGLFGRYITGISGDYTNVVGLPASAVYRNLKTLLES